MALIEIDGLPFLIAWWFSMAMLNNQMVTDNRESSVYKSNVNKTMSSAPSSRKITIFIGGMWLPFPVMGGLLLFYPQKNRASIGGHHHENWGI